MKINVTTHKFEHIVLAYPRQTGDHFPIDVFTLRGPLPGFVTPAREQDSNRIGYSSYAMLRNSKPCFLKVYSTLPTFTNQQHKNWNFVAMTDQNYHNLSHDEFGLTLAKISTEADLRMQAKYAVQGEKIEGRKYLHFAKITRDGNVDFPLDLLRYDRANFAAASDVEAANDRKISEIYIANLSCDAKPAWAVSIWKACHWDLEPASKNFADLPERIKDMVA